MDTAPHHPDLVAFIASLQRLEDILSLHDQHIWAAKIGRVKILAKASDGHCIDLFLRMFGGMGSFNDLVMVAPNDANDTLHAERQRAYELARALR